MTYHNDPGNYHNESQSDNTQPAEYRGRLKGHGLVLEGAAHDYAGRRITPPMTTSGPGRAKCACGELSENFYSQADRKRWHYRHKAEELQCQEEIAKLEQQAQQSTSARKTSTGTGEK